MNRKFLDNLISIYTLGAILVLTLLLCYTVYNFFDAKSKGYLKMMLNTNSIIDKSYLSLKSPNGFDEFFVDRIINENPSLDSLSIYVNDQPAFILEDQANPSKVIKLLRKIGKETIDQSMIDEHGNTIRVIVSSQTIDPNYMIGPLKAVASAIVGLIIATFFLLILEYKIGDKLDSSKKNENDSEDKDIDDPWYDEDIDLDEGDLDIESEDLEANDLDNRLAKTKAPVIDLPDEDVEEHPHQLAKRLKAELELTSDGDGEGVSYGVFEPIEEKTVSTEDRGYGVFGADNDDMPIVSGEDNIGIEDDDSLIDYKINEDNISSEIDDLDEAKLDIDEEDLATINNLEEEDSGDLPDNIELPDNSADLIGVEDFNQRSKDPIEFTIEAKKKLALFVANLFNEQKISATRVSVAVLSGTDNNNLEQKLSDYASNNGFYTDRLDDELVLAMNFSNKADSEEALLKLAKELDDDAINIGYTYSQNRTMKPALLIQESLAAFNHSRISGQHITSFDVDIESYKKEFNL